MTQAETFVFRMEEIWNINLEPTKDGGVYLFHGPDYQDCHDAISMAYASGAWPKWANKLGGEPARTFEWPDGSRATVNSRSCKVSKRHRKG